MFFFLFGFLSFKTSPRILQSFRMLQCCFAVYVPGFQTAWEWADNEWIFVPLFWLMIHCQEVFFITQCLGHNESWDVAYKIIPRTLCVFWLLSLSCVLAWQRLWKWSVYSDAGIFHTLIISCTLQSWLKHAQGFKFHLQIWSVFGSL